MLNCKFIYIPKIDNNLDQKINNEHCDHDLLNKIDIIFKFYYLIILIFCYFLFSISMRKEGDKIDNIKMFFNAIVPLIFTILIPLYLKKNFKLNLQFNKFFRTIIKEIYKK